MIGDCDRPPAWCEAHHIDEWDRDFGLTNIADGIVLCRFPHLNLHNNHWRVVRVDDTYWLKPPPDIDPERKLIPLPSKSRAYREAMVEFRTKRGAAETKSERGA